MKKKRRLKKSVINALLNIVMVLLLALMGFSIYNIIAIQKDYKVGRTEYDFLHSEVVEQVSEDTYLTVNHELSQSHNEGYTGWIEVPGTVISYPTVKGEDNQYYVTHTFVGKQYKGGAIFLDYRNASDYSDYNTIIYGHMMKDGSMFNNMEKYNDETFFTTNNMIRLYTPQGIRLYKIFSFYETKDDSKAYTLKFADDVEFQQFLDFTKESSMYKTDENLLISDKIITLSTCSRGVSPYRWIIHAKLIEIVQK